MPTDRHLDDRISNWLEGDAPLQLPDRVLLATFERTSRTRQEIGWQAVLRRFPMNRLVAAVAGVALGAVIGVIGLGLYANRPGIGGVSLPSPTSQPSLLPTGAPTATLPATVSATPITSPAASTSPTSATATGAPLLTDGPLAPGSYTYLV